MAFADLLLGTDLKRERWLPTGVSLLVTDTLVHNWLHRTGILRGLQAEHAYGPACSAAIWMRTRIASPELLPDAEPLPHLICSPPELDGGGADEAGEHGNAR